MSDQTTKPIITGASVEFTFRVTHQMMKSLVAEHATDQFGFQVDTEAMLINNFESQSLMVSVQLTDPDRAGLLREEADDLQRSMGLTPVSERTASAAFAELNDDMATQIARQVYDK